MSASPPPPASLPCRRDPERWFDPRHRRDALAGCLACPARAWCAQEALSCNASWGMWAGMWIEGCHDNAVPSLTAIANGDYSAVDRHVPAAGASTEHRPRPAAALLARSSGHCEVLTDSCRYTFDRTVNRCPTAEAGEKPSPAELFAACGACADIVARLDRQLAARLGYLVAAGRDPASVPFPWRGSRWVLLDRDGWLTEIRDDAQTA